MLLIVAIHYTFLLDFNPTIMEICSFYPRKIGFTKFSHSARHSSAATSWDLDETPEDDMCVLKLEKEKRS